MVTIGQPPIRHVAGNHIRIATDDDPAAATRMVTTVDAAVKLWADRLNVPQPEWSTLTIDALVMRDEQPFRNELLLPPGLPNFRYGYATPGQIYVRVQPGPYYTRHLVLHESAHAFALQVFGSLGPTWFMEGLAEYLATHAGTSADVRIGVLPADRREFAYWGRFKTIAAARREAHLPSIDQVMRYSATLAGDVRSYAFSWALIAMLDAYPEYRELIPWASRMQFTSATDFNRQFRRKIQPGGAVLSSRWQLWLHALDYGIDPSRHLLDIAVTDPPIPESLSIAINADRSWQSIGYRVPAGTRLSITARGRAVIATEPADWVTTPRGVTLRYVDGRPAGQLLAAVLPCNSPHGGTLPPLCVQPIGPFGQWTVERDSWLVLKSNEATGEFADNTGGFEVTIIATSDEMRRP